MAITQSLIEDIFGIPRDGRNIQDDTEEEVITGDNEGQVPFAQKVAELREDLATKVAQVPLEPKTEAKKVEVKTEQVSMTNKPPAGIFGGLFDDDEPTKDAAPQQPSTPVPSADEVKAEVKVESKAEAVGEVKTEAQSVTKATPKREVRSEMKYQAQAAKPKVIMPDPEPPAVDFDSVPDPVAEVVTDDDDSDESPCKEWTSDDEWNLKSPSPKFNKFYFEKATALNPGPMSILPGGAIDFTKYFNELSELNCDVTVATFDLELIHQKMQMVQQLRERCKQIQLHASQQFYLWERYIELFHGILCRVEYERGKQDGVYFEHMKDMEHYFCSLKALHRTADQVMRTLDGAFECLSRQVTIAMPMREIERYGGPSTAPRPITPEQRKYDALGAPTKPSNSSAQQTQSGPIQWGQ
jgi:hypothetical protein